MPSRRVHEVITQKLLGKAYRGVHRTMDSAAEDIGPTHRKVGHDHVTAVLLGVGYWDPFAFLAAELHMATDRFVSALKKRRR